MTNLINRVNAPVSYQYLNSSLTNITGTGGDYLIKFDTVSFGNGYNTSTGLFTVPVTGNYLAVFSLLFANITSGANNNISHIVMGSTDYRLSELSCTTAKTPSLTYQVNGAITSYLTAGQTIGFYARMNNGSSALVGLTGGTSPYTTFSFIKYIP